MNKLLEQALDSINMTSFYVNKESYSGECVVYNYISGPSYYADNMKQGEDYTILLNLYCKSGIEAKKKLIVKTLNSFGISGGRAQVPVLESTGYYNIAIQFNGFIRESL